MLPKTGIKERNIIKSAAIIDKINIEMGSTEMFFFVMVNALANPSNTGIFSITIAAGRKLFDIEINASISTKSEMPEKVSTKNAV